MFHKIAVKVFVCLTVFTFVPGALVFANQCENQGQQCDMKAKSCPVARKCLNMCKGEVVSVDAAANVLTLKCKKSECQVALSGKTVINCGKEIKAVSDLVPGTMVVVHYKTKDGKKEATKILIKPVAEDSSCHKK
ncbi:MAG: hypothetical protein A2297_03970 [Elusimicrobia bacterium RIFOXYB2_FULL_48_7]|nr:MAG: hypothetical protein A2297_03970 [Elusimicrobia bacterium RIFOXYB2_FULL_48_7]